LPDAVVALYLPRALVEPDGEYTAEFNATFIPANFPCSTADPAKRAATTCCLVDFAARYHVVTSLVVPAAAECGGGGGAGLLPPPLNSSDAVSGSFGVDLPGSSVTLLPAAAGQANGVLRAQLVLAHTDLRAAASSYSVAGGVEAIEAFVGLAEMVPVPGSRVLDSSATQIRLSLEKSDYFAVTTAGTEIILSDINVGVSEVMDAAARRAHYAPRRAQYATVSFTLTGTFAPNPATGLVPPSLIRVGAGGSRAHVNWTNTCARPVAPAFSQRLAQRCGPGVAMCAADTLASGFVTIHVPLITADGGDLFDLDSSSPQQVFVEFVVSAVDGEGRPARTTLSATLPVLEGGVDTWCYAQAAAVMSEDDVECVDVLVGVAGTAGDLERLQTAALDPTTAGTPNTTRSLSARSLEGGLLTLVVRAKEPTAGQPPTALEVEDLVALHITGDFLFAQVAAALAAPGGGFRVVAGSNDVNQASPTASLVPSAALAALCGPTASPLPAASCILRYDIQARAPTAGLAMEVMPGRAVDATRFMQDLLGESPYAAALGANYSALIADRYRLSPAAGKSRRAFWVNPGFQWAAGSDAAGRARFSLSQRIVVAALINAVPADSAARRSVLLAATTHSAAAASAAIIEFGVSVGEMVATQRGLPADRASVWRIGLRLSDAIACLPPVDRNDAVSTLLAKCLAAAGASAVAYVGIVSADVRTAGACLRRAEPAGATGGATGSFETVVAFSGGAERPTFSASRLAQIPGILSVEPLSVPAAILVDSPGQETPFPAAAPATEAPASPVEGGMVAAIVGGGIAAAVVSAGAVGVIVWRRRSNAWRKVWVPDGKDTSAPPPEPIVVAEWSRALVSNPDVSGFVTVQERSEFVTVQERYSVQTYIL